MTYLEIVNQTLRRLREDEVTTVSSSDFSTLIGDLVNLTKREVEDAWRWKALRSEFSFGLGLFTSSTYSLTDWGKRSVVKDVFDITNNSTVLTMSDERWRRMVDIGGTVDSDRALYWRINGYDSSGDPLLEIYPVPGIGETSTLRVYGCVAQADLSADTDELSVPDYPVLLGTYARAVSERGEDSGASYDETFRDFQSALNDAIAIDASNEAGGFASDWVVV